MNKHIACKSSLFITFWKSLSKKQVLVLHPMCLGVLVPSEFRGEAKKFEGEAPPVPPLDETLQALWFKIILI